MTAETYQPVFFVDPFDRIQFYQEIKTVDDYNLWYALHTNLPTLALEVQPLFGTA